jgi:HK97 family phage prohead protease
MATLVGYAAVFDKISNPMGTGARQVREVIRSGAFTKAVAAVARGHQNVFAYFNHGVAGGIPEAALPLGSSRDGSLRLRQDNVGLRFELDLPDTSDGRDLAEMVQRGTVRGVSFGFDTRSVVETWDHTAKPPVRVIHQIGIVGDISPTHMPVYPDTSVSLGGWAGMDQRRSRLRVLERSLDEQRRQRVMVLETDLRRARLRELERTLRIA